ncbi:F-box/RNI superfamily protein [Medicago truncatula]|uniref:F-box/RNI superfamily protein n=1 Tax=Medicago truncatula TaxID=3880 RepID=G8A1U5_MEDTR|nr:F-box/RNI superfamily protein [Medicago truncatula]
MEKRLNGDDLNSLLGTSNGENLFQGLTRPRVLRKTPTLKQDPDETRRMDDFLEESRIRQKSKKRRICKVKIAENEDRPSDLPDGILLYILSSLNTKHAIRTCVLSKRWKHLSKRIPSLILHSSRFSTVKQFKLLCLKGNVDSDARTLFPKSLNLPALTSLGVTNFVFCGGENGCATPFLAFKRLNSLTLRDSTYQVNNLSI